MAFWVNFLYPTDQEDVYLTNGGHTTRCHGVAMTYDRGSMKFRYRKRSGEEWETTVDNVLPGRWYHVTSTWDDANGLTVYLDGKAKAADFSKVVK